MKSVKVFSVVAIFGFWLCAANAQTFLTNGLVAYYKFDGNANDASGNGLNATFAGGVLNSTDRYGGVGKAAFVPHGGVITVPPSALLQATATTFSFWFQSETNILTDHLENKFCLLLTSSGDHHPLLYLNDTLYGLTNMTAGYWWGSLSPPYVTANYRLPISKWTHFCLVINGTTRTLFINGIQIYQANDYFGNAAYPLTEIGNLNPAYNQGARGAFDDFRIYNRALTTNQVAQLYAIETAPTISIQKAVYLTSTNLLTGSNYVVQASTDLSNWTNQGSVFTATNSVWRSTNYWDVVNWNQASFRLQLQ